MVVRRKYIRKNKIMLSMGGIASATIGGTVIKNKTKNTDKNNLNKPSFTQEFGGYASSINSNLIVPKVKLE